MSDLLPDDTIQAVTVEKLHRRFGGGSDRTWERERAALVRRGVLVKRGKRIFGRLGDVASEIMGGGTGGGR